MAKILVIDDSREFCKLVHMVLTRSQHEVIEANSGPEGLQTAAAQQPEIILLDYMMPGMDGFEVFRLLREGETTRHIPVIMITAFTGLNYHSSRVDALKLGLDDYLSKPITPVGLNQAIADVLHWQAPREHKSPLPHAPGMPEIAAQPAPEPEPQPEPEPAAEDGDGSSDVSPSETEGAAPV